MQGETQPYQLQHTRDLDDFLSTTGSLLDNETYLVKQVSWR